MTRLPLSKGFSRPFGKLVVVAVGGLAWSQPGAVWRGSGKDPAPVFEAIQREVQTIFAKCRSAIVRIEANDERGYLSGTGFFIDPNGTLYTSYTIGGESRDIEVAFGGKRYHAERLVSDLRSGIAILKIDAETPFLTFGNSQKLEVASPVIAIGYPMDLPLTPVFGTVGGFDLKYHDRYFATAHIRANIPVQRGEGGAPLINARGEAIGILISRVESGNASYVLPIEAAEKVRRDFVRFHEVRPGWIGVKVKPLDDGRRTVPPPPWRKLSPMPPARKAGLRAGDVILQVGTHHITCPEDVVDASFFLSAEDQTVIRIARDGAERGFQRHARPIIPISTAHLCPPSPLRKLPAPALKIGH